MKNIDLATKLSKIKHDLIAYKAHTRTVADSTPLYRATITFPAFASSTPVVRSYEIELIFDVSPVLIQPYTAACDNNSFHAGVENYYTITEISLSKPNTLYASQYYTAPISFTIFTTAELKSYNVSYSDIQVGTY